MNQITYKYFVTIAQADSMKQAADTLMISPQALSEHMRKLEQEIGAELFTHTRPVQLTACGRRFLRYAETALFERYQMEKEMRELSDRHQEIVLSIPPSDFPPYLIDVIRMFAVRYPSCLITVHERQEPVSASTLKGYDLNLSNSRLSNGMEEVEIQKADSRINDTNPAVTNYLSVLAHRSLLQRIWGDSYEDKLAHLRTNPNLALFSGIPFIRLLNDSHESVSEDLFRAAGILPSIVVKSESTDLCLSLCTAGVGAMITSDGWARWKLSNRINGQDLMLFRMREAHPLTGMIISYQKGKTLSEEEAAFIEMMRGYVNRL